MRIMRIKENDHADAGFTLIELVVTFVIMMMLTSLSVVGLMSYQDYADYKRQNSYAQTLFLAAQTKLTAYSERGQLEALQEVSTQELPLHLVKIANGVVADQCETGASVKTGPIYYLYGGKENYLAYCEGEYRDKKDLASQQYQALYDILDEFMVDKTILQGNVAVEYNPENGLVYSVLYSDKCGAFTYTGNTVNGVVNVLDRREQIRNERMLGYYGVDG